jgi:hypothetical protein
MPTLQKLHLCSLSASYADYRTKGTRDVERALTSDLDRVSDTQTQTVRAQVDASRAIHADHAPAAIAPGTALAALPLLILEERQRYLNISSSIIVFCGFLQTLCTQRLIENHFKHRIALLR